MTSPRPLPDSKHRKTERFRRLVLKAGMGLAIVGLTLGLVMGC